MKKLLLLPLLAAVSSIGMAAPSRGPSFSINDVRVTEGGIATFTITKSGSVNAQSSVIGYSTKSGTASLADYISATGTVTFAASEVRKTVSIQTLQDITQEGNHAFTVRIRANSNGRVIDSSGTATIVDDDAAASSTPTPEPTPSPTPTATPSASPIEGVGGSPIFDNFNPYDSLEVNTNGIPPVFLPDPGAFRFFCGPGQIANLDPIVYPNGTSPHGHQFFGNLTVSSSAIYSTLRLQGFSTCGDPAINPVNRSSYWQPAMLDGVGNVVIPWMINVYYKQPSKNRADTQCAVNTGNVAADLNGKVGYCVTIPNGLRFIKGYKMDMTGGGPLGSDADYLKYGCRLPDQGDFISGATDKHSLEELTATGLCTAGNDLHVKLISDHCWDGVNLDTTNHRSHMSPANRLTGSPQFVGCPTSHPYIIPELTLQAHYRIDSTFNTWEWTSDRQMRNMGHTIIRGETLHFDYHEAWSPTIKSLWQNNCLEANRTCSGGDLGNGYKIKGMMGPPGGWTIPAKVPATGVN